jgi:hypothetical protein
MLAVLALVHHDVLVVFAECIKSVMWIWLLGLPLGRRERAAYGMPQG